MPWTLLWKSFCILAAISFVAMLLAYTSVSVPFYVAEILTCTTAGFGCGALVFSVTAYNKARFARWEQEHEQEIAEGRRLRSGEAVYRHPDTQQEFLIVAREGSRFMVPRAVVKDVIGEMHKDI